MYISKKLKQEIISNKNINNEAIASKLKEEIQNIENNILPSSSFDDYYTSIINLIDLYCKLGYFESDDKNTENILARINELADIAKLFDVIKMNINPYQEIINKKNCSDDSIGYVISSTSKNDLFIQSDVNNENCLYDCDKIDEKDLLDGQEIEKVFPENNTDAVRENEQHTPYFDMVDDQNTFNFSAENTKNIKKCKITDEQNKLEPEIKMNIEAEKNNLKNYNFVNHPIHYNNYDIEVIEMMRRIWGDEIVKNWCILTAWKYRQRMGTKPGEDIQRDINKEQWYLKKAEDIQKQMKY